MIQRRISFQVSTHTFIFVSLLTEIFHGVACLVIRNQVTFRFDGFNQNQNLNQHSYSYYGPNFTFIDTVEDNDPNYPYEQLLQLVKDTKRILSSSNLTEKMQLNLDPGIYDAYLNGDFSDTNLDFTKPIVQTQTHYPAEDYVPHAVPGAAYSPSYEPNYNPCPEDVQYQIPQRLTGIDDKDYFIINVGNDLRQKYNSVICKYHKHICGGVHAVQDYTFTCEQSYNRIRDFISIPVGNRISLDQQRVQSFKVPDGCYCRGSRNLE